MNADIRYQILGRTDGESRKFIIDPITGQVRSIVSFANDAGRVYGFDVKATDKRGADDGRSAITNVFVSSDNNLLVLKIQERVSFLKKTFPG